MEDEKIALWQKRMEQGMPSPHCLCVRVFVLIQKYHRNNLNCELNKWINPDLFDVINISEIWNTILHVPHAYWNR